MVLLDAEYLAHGVKYQLGRHLLAFDGNGTSDDATGHVNVYRTEIGELRVRDNRTDGAFELTDVVLHVLSDELDTFFSELNTAVCDTALQDLPSELQVRTVDAEHHRTLDARHDAGFHTLEVHGGNVTGDDDLLAEEVEVIEDVEEGLLRLRLPDKPLDVVDDQDVHLLVEVDEHASLCPTHQTVTDELRLKLGARHVAYTHRRVKLHSSLANGLAEVRLPHTTGTVDEDEVQGSLPRTSCSSFSDAKCFTIASTLIEGLEAKVCTQMRRIVLRPCDLSRRRSRCHLCRSQEDL